MEPGSLVALIVSAVGVCTVLARVVEVLVKHLIDSSRRKNKQHNDDLLIPNMKMTRGGYTADLAIQKQTVEGVHNELDEVHDVATAIHVSVTKDLPFLIATLISKQDLTHDEMKEFKAAIERLHTALEGNTTATRMLYDLMASLLKVQR